jgi:hypothetical protein
MVGIHNSTMHSSDSSKSLVFLRVNEPGMSRESSRLEYILAVD